MDCEIVSTSARPDLAETTGLWRWAAFFARDGADRESVLAAERAAARATSALPRVLVSLSDGLPVGMAALAAEDLETRRDLTPWLAGVYVVPEHRGQGHASRLVRAVEDLARRSFIPTLWLYTHSAEPLYRRCGWQRVEVLERRERICSLMRRDLAS